MPLTADDRVTSAAVSPTVPGKGYEPGVTVRPSDVNGRALFSERKRDAFADAATRACDDSDLV